MTKQRLWYETLFADFRPFFGMISTRRTNEQVRFVVKLLGLKKGMSFFDCPCGIGRIAIPLAERGIKVTGVDITKSYLDELNEAARRKGLKIDTVHADMRRITYRNRFDTAANLWTSLGYFESESQNLLILRKIYRSLKPGGRFLLHIINRDWILHYYTDSDWTECGGVISLESRKFDYATSTNRGVWRFIKDGKTTEHSVGIRLYSYHELIAMFRKVGFVEIEGFGSTKGGPVDRNANMIWIVGTKPKETARRRA